jgi:hypothetical protein
MQIHLGYAADEQGRGVAYARVQSRAGERLVRVAFRVRRHAGLGGREVSYGALTAIAELLRGRGIKRAIFHVPDASLVSDWHEHRDVPVPLELPYVRLRCTLNAFAEHTLRANDENDLCARARAEVALYTAA